MYELNGKISPYRYVQRQRVIASIHLKTSFITGYKDLHDQFRQATDLCTSAVSAD